MGRNRISKDGHRLTQTELNRRFQEKDVSIDEELDKAIQSIDKERRTRAEQSLYEWVKTYCIGLLLDDAPPAKGKEVLDIMEKTITSHRFQMTCLPRGSGKSSYIECTTLYALATGLQKYVVIISNNSRAASGLMADIFRAIAEPDTNFANDYPEICLPFQISKGSFRKRQLYKGLSTEIQKNSSNLVFARLKDDDGRDLPTSGSLVTVRGVSSGLRGMKHGTLRPSLVLLDDLQTSEIAENPEAVEKLVNIIKKDVIPLGGKERVSILQTATPIQPEDLVDRIKNDKSWTTTIFPAVISFPKNEKLWKEYWKIYDSESVLDGNHDKSLDFYKKNQVKMDEGSEVFNPTRYSVKDGHISGIQKMLELQHILGDVAFGAEYQMQPQKISYSLDLNSKIVSSRIGDNPKLVVPDGCTFIACATDLNVSYGLTTTITAFKPDMTAFVIYHKITRCRIDSKLNDTAYAQKVYDNLVKLGKELKALGIKIDGWAIDAGGRNWDAVCTFAKSSLQTVGISACAFAGRASLVFNPFVRSRLRDSIGKTVLCGDNMEHTKSGSGFKYIFFDADFYKEQVQRAFLSELGNIGSCQLYKAIIDEHTEFAIQVCNEKLRYVKHRQDGRDEYMWKSFEPHDYLDTMSMCYACASSQGLSGGTIQRNDIKNKVIIKKRPTRFRFV